MQFKTDLTEKEIKAIFKVLEPGDVASWWRSEDGVCMCMGTFWSTEDSGRHCGSVLDH